MQCAGYDNNYPYNCKECIRYMDDCNGAELSIEQVISDNAYAMTFQSIAQYRQALLDFLREGE